MFRFLFRRAAPELDALADELAWEQRACRIADRVSTAHDESLARFEARALARANQEAARASKSGSLKSLESTRQGVAPRAAAASTASARAQRGKTARGARGARTGQ